MVVIQRAFALLATLCAAATGQTTWYVDVAGTPPGSGTQNDPYTSIQYAIDQPSTLDGDTLLVATGAYFESVDYRGKALLVDGGGADPLPVIDAGGVGSAVVFATGEGRDSVLRGFVVTGAMSSGIVAVGASPTLEELVVRDNEAFLGSGGGFCASSGGQPLVRDSLFENNTAAGGGGGACGSYDTSVVFEDCIFRGNAAAVGGALSRATARRCRIEGNDAADNGYGQGGGAAWCVLEDCTLIDNLAEDLGGGAAHCTILGGALLHNRVVREQQGVARGGGAFMGTARGTLFRGNRVLAPSALGGGAYDTRLADCVLVANEADRGGGAFFWGTLPVGGEFRGCTFVANRASVEGGGIFYSGYAGGTCEDSILWGNSPDQLALDTLVVRYSCVEGGVSGVGNIALDPMLFGPAGSDPHLLAGSPCIDAGDPNGPPDPDGTRADIGAVPFDPAWPGGAFAYCSPRRTGAGCLPLTTAVGSPSLSGPDDFVVGATGVPPGVPGLLFHGLGADAVPYLGGLLCVAEPRIRMDVQLSTASSEPCGGTFRQPVSQATLIGLGLVPGDRLYLQYWFRPFAKGRTSDAIEAYVLP